MRTCATLIAGAWLAVLPACSPAPVTPDMNAIAERYVKVVLLVGQHDANFVDAYYGDPAWKPGGAPGFCRSGTAARGGRRSRWLRRASIRSPWICATRTEGMAGAKGGFRPDWLVVGADRCVSSESE